MTEVQKPAKRSPGRPAKPKVTPPAAQSEIDDLKAQLEELKALLKVQAQLNQPETTPVATLQAMMAPSFEQPGTKVLIHFVEDGFTFGGHVWYRGQEIEFTVGTPEWQKTFRGGEESWVALAYDTRAQQRKYGKVMYRPGPWDGLDYEGGVDINGKHWTPAEVAAAEARRGRKLPPAPRSS